MDAVCKECDNYITIKFKAGKEIPVCGGNVPNFSECPIHRDLMGTVCKDMTLNMLSEKTGMSPYRVRILICRAEFAHVKRKIVDKRVWFTGLTKSDIRRLKELAKWKGRGGEEEEDV